MTTYQPRNDYVTIRGDEAETRRGTLYLPANATKVPSRGTVEAVGPGYILANGDRAPLDLKPGDRVEFILRQDTHHIRESEALVFYLTRECDVVAILADETQPEMQLPGEEQSQEDAPPPARPDEFDTAFHRNEPRERIIVGAPAAGDDVAPGVPVDEAASSAA